MNIIRYPEKSEWKKIVERPHLDVSQLNQTVASVLADVRQRGDEAVKGYELKFDQVPFEEGGDTTRSGLLAEERSYREGWSLYPWRHCPTLLYGADAGYSR